MATKNLSTLTVAGGPDASALLPRPFLFVVLDCRRLLAPSSRHPLEGVDEVVIGRGQRGATRVHNRALRVTVPDEYVSTTHALLRREPGRWVIEDRSKNGTFVNGQRVEHAELADRDLVEMAGTFFIFRKGLESSHDDRTDVVADEIPVPAEGLATLLPPVKRMFQQIERIARSPVSIVLRGETGTGKEVLARAIHHLSRRAGPFLAVNCGAIPDALVESELFGHRKGAFSGAVDDRIGLIRAAERGTLLLDEVGDLPLPSQAALLRVLQEREVRPVGGTKPVSVDVRFLSASHLDLRERVAAKTFRADLEARLNGIEIDVPPLRERREDLGILIAAILRRVFPDLARDVVLDRQAARALLVHGWPKNIRELEQTLTSAVVLAGRLAVGLRHLPAALRKEPAPASLASEVADPAVLREIVRHLEEQRGNISGVARAMGKTRKQVQRWLKRYGLDAASFRR